MIHLGRRSYPYMEEVNEGIVRAFQRLAPETGRALDVGCGRGQLGEAVRALGWDVWGIEQDPGACSTAGARLNRVVCADLNDQAAVRAGLGNETFDALVFSDVLEHVYDPRTTLERYLEWLKPGARVLISVPNAVVWTNRIRWTLGRVEYEDTGVMDRTHIRFFTFATAEELVRSTGCTIDQVTSTPYVARAVLPLVKKVIGSKGSEETDPSALIKSAAYRRYMKFVYPAERAAAAMWRSMLAFRIIVVGRKPATS